MGRGVLRRRGPQRASVAGDRAAGLCPDRRGRRRADDRPGRQPAAHGGSGHRRHDARAGDGAPAAGVRDRRTERPRRRHRHGVRTVRRGGAVAAVPNVGRSPSGDRGGLRSRRPRARGWWAGARRGDAGLRRVGGGTIDQPTSIGRIGPLGARRAGGTDRAASRAVGDRRRRDGRRLRVRPARRAGAVGGPRRLGRRGRRRRRRRVSDQCRHQPRRGVPVRLDVGHLARLGRPRSRSRGRAHGGRPRSCRRGRRGVRSGRCRRSHHLHVRVQRLEGRDGRADRRRPAAGRAGRDRPRTGNHASTRRVHRRNGPLRHGRCSHGRRRDRHPDDRQCRAGARGDHDRRRTGAAAGH